MPHIQVMEKDKMDKFETEMSLWKNEQSRQAMEFTITEKDLEADRIQSTAHLMVSFLLLIYYFFISFAWSQ